MTDILIGGGLALIVGTALSFANYFITKKLIENKKSSSPIAIISFLRQTFNIAYLVAIYFLSELLPWPVEAMLIGAALGVTVPSFILSAKLSKEIAAKAQKKSADYESAGQQQN